MKKFSTVESIPAYLPIVNIDTDMIIPKQFLKTIKRTGLGKNLFYELRYDNKGNIISDFVLNKEPYKNSKILIAGKNFGCGSSREHAPWALVDFGITCVISSSYADIFYNNCFKNGVLPVVLSKTKTDQLRAFLHSNPGSNVKIDLAEQIVCSADGIINHFDISPTAKHNLMMGLGQIGLTMKHSNAIDDFELRYKANMKA